MGINMRSEFDKIIKNYGHNIYLQRRIYSTGEGIYQIPPNLKESWYSDKLEKWTVRETFAGRKTALTDIAEERPEGIVHTVNRVWYFQWNSNPREGDRIYENDPRFDGGEIYLIDYAQPFRGEHGKIIFWEVGGTREGPS